MITWDKVRIIFSHNCRTQLLGTFDDVTLGFTRKYFKSTTQIYANVLSHEKMIDTFQSSFAI